MNDKNYIGRKFILPYGYGDGETITINAQDDYGIYYELDEKQWIWYWCEVGELEPYYDYGENEQDGHGTLGGKYEHI